jgi:phosphoribosylanthranilate isomerase
MTWVKICGTTNLRDAELSIAAGADALGFIFAPSPRGIDVEAAARIMGTLRGRAEMIGVFVNEAPERVADIATRAGLTGIQLQGDEPAERLSEFRQAVGDRKIIKTLHANAVLSNGAGTLSEYLAARELIDAILLDSGSAQQRGGTGVAYDWNQVLPIVEQVRKTMPLIIAGGLNAVNVARGIELFDPFGVDVVSGVESRPGEKDEKKVNEFVATVRQAIASPRQKM